MGVREQSNPLIVENLDLMLANRWRYQNNFFSTLTEACDKSEAQHEQFRVGKIKTLTPPFMAESDSLNLADSTSTPSRNAWVPGRGLLAVPAPAPAVLPVPAENQTPQYPQRQITGAKRNMRS